MAQAKNQPLGKMALVVYDCVFHRKVHVLLNYSEDDFTKWARAKGDKDYQRDERAAANLAAFSSQMDSTTEPTEWIICLRHFDWTVVDQGTLIHEIVHTVIKIFALNNIPFSFDTQEFIAHMVGNMYEDIAKQIQVRSKGKHRR